MGTFGEKITDQLTHTDRGPTERWQPGIFLGISVRSTAISVGRDDGAVGEARSFPRLPQSDSIDVGMFDAIVGTWWCPAPYGPRTEPKVGFTDGCQGGVASYVGQTGVVHSEFGRARAERLLWERGDEMDTERIAEADRRREEYRDTRARRTTREMFPDAHGMSATLASVQMVAEASRSSAKRVRQASKEAPVEMDTDTLTSSSQAAASSAPPSALKRGLETSPEVEYRTSKSGWHGGGDLSCLLADAAGEIWDGVILDFGTCDFTSEVDRKDTMTVIDVTKPLVILISSLGKSQHHDGHCLDIVESCVAVGQLFVHTSPTDHLADRVSVLNVCSENVDDGVITSNGLFLIDGAVAGLGEQNLVHMGLASQLRLCGIGCFRIESVEAGPDA